MREIFIVLFSLMLLSCNAFEDKNVIASVNGRDITAEEFGAYLDFKRIKVRDDKHRQLLLDEYLEREAMSEVIEQGLDKHSRLVTQAELADFKRQMNISRYFQKYLKDSVTDQKIQNYYSANPDQYSETKAHVAHILFRLDKNMQEPERKAKLTTAMEAWSKLKADEDFAGIVENYSEDRISAKKGGDLGWLKQGAIDPKFSKKIFEMKKGEISEPFETSFGYHIVKIIEPAKTVKKPFEAVKGDIRYLLRQQTKQAELDRLKASVKIDLRN
jgi:peptidyl-prolyl cis-trans isomerase C